MKKAYLVLEDGRSFEGIRFGAESECTGEFVFTTGVCGFVETLTDPASYGRIMMQTFPLIGNYGVCEEDFESEFSPCGYVVREFCEIPSNFRSQYDINTLLKNKGIVGLAGVDTRQLTKILREEGSMRAAICDSVPKDLSQNKNHTTDDPVKSITCDVPKIFGAKEEKYRVTLIDYGVKRSIINALLERGCTVCTVPADTSAAQILAASPDAVMLSGGPGNPTEYTERAAQLAELVGKLPIFGVGLGHQLLALSQGGKISRLKFGHGAGQPVQSKKLARTYITAQNHLYTVENGSVMGGETVFINLNDGTCEGIEYPNKQAFTVQFYPEGTSGPEGTAFLYEQFINMIESKKCAGGKN